MKRSLPVRVRLTLWSTAVVAVVLLATAATSYSLLARFLSRRTERDLAETARTALSSMRVVAQGVPDSARASALNEAADRLRFADRRVLFYQGDRLVAASRVPPVGPTRAPFLLPPLAPTTLQAVLRAGGSAVLPPPAPGTAHVRAYVRELRPPRGRPGGFTVAVLGSTREEDALLAAARMAFLLAIPLGILLAGLGSYLLARQSLAPVAAMTRRASRIGAATLEDRLPVPASGDELAELASVLNLLLGRLHDAFEQQRRFMADAAHELRTPVAVLRAEADVALSRAERPGAEYRETLGVISEEAIRLSTIVDDLFTLARADAGEQALRREPVQLAELLRDTGRSLGRVAEQRGVDLTVEAPPPLVVEGDEGLLRRMLSNLVDNALKYTPPGGRVRVTAQPDDAMVRISVRDTGPGIPAAARERVFERFYRAEEVRASDEVGGAGLGLPIARWIAEAHGGTLRLQETGPEGTTFTATLPARTAPADRPSPR